MHLILGLFLSLNLLAASEHVVELKNQSQIYAVSSVTAPTARPTFIFLPGIYRGFLKQEAFLQLLSEKKINWVAMHFSRHPESVIAGTPVWKGLVTPAQLADEVLQVKRVFKIKKPIVVSLSYSASVVPYLSVSEFPLVVETAPMGRADENTPREQNFTEWQKWMSLFPIWGNWMVNSTQYMSFRYYWMTKIQELFPTYPHYKQHHAAIAEGLTQLTFAAQNFDLREQDFKMGPQRYWVIGKNENAARKKIQLEAIEAYRQQRGLGRQNPTLEIPKAGHIVPTEQPDAYVQALEKILKSVAR